MESKLSIIMPVYNVEKYLKECIDSILSQTFKDFELICIDDGSTDSSLDILNDYASKDSRIKILIQKNQYAGVARNRGIEIAQGEYLLFLDSDDFFEKDMFENIYKTGIESKADIIMFGSRKYDDKTKTYVKAQNFLRRDYIGSKQIFNRKDFPDRLLSITTPAPWSKAYRREYILKENIFFQPLQNSNDVYFVLIAISCAEKIAWIDKCFVNYRIGMSTNLQSTKVKNPTCFLEAFIAVYDELNKRGIYQEIEQAFINAFLFAIAYNIKTICSYSALRKVYFMLSESKVKNMKLLDHDENYYLRKKDVDDVTIVYKIIEFIEKHNQYDSMIEQLSDCIKDESINNTFVEAYIYFKVALKYLDYEMDDDEFENSYQLFEKWINHSKEVFIKLTKQEQEIYKALEIKELKLFEVHVVKPCVMEVKYKKYNKMIQKEENRKILLMKIKRKIKKVINYK